MLSLALFSSCITSYNGLVTYDKVVTEDRILGTWSYDNMRIQVEPLVKSKIANVCIAIDLRNLFRCI